MERDEETGLSYHSARYYISWLGRWLNPDPIGIGDGVNVYGYCGGNPVTYNDTIGTQVGSKSPTYSIAIYPPSDLRDANARRTTSKTSDSPVQNNPSNVTMNPSNLLSVSTGATSLPRQDSITPGTGSNQTELILQKIAQEKFRTEASQYAIQRDYLSGGELHQELDDDHTTTGQLGYQWIWGTGKPVRTFNENSIMGRQMLATPEVQNQIHQMLTKLSSTGASSLTMRVSRSAGEENPFLYPISFLKDLHDNPARAFHGSFTGVITATATRIPETNEMQVTMFIQLEDKMTAISATHVPFGNYNESSIGYENNPYGPKGQFRTIYINYAMTVNMVVPIAPEAPASAPSSLTTPSFGPQIESTFIPIILNNSPR